MDYSDHILKATIPIAADVTIQSLLSTLSSLAPPLRGVEVTAPLPEVLTPPFEDEPEDELDEELLAMGTRV
jgi:hypothetical protein